MNFKPPKTTIWENQAPSFRVDQRQQGGREPASSNWKTLAARKSWSDLNTLMWLKKTELLANKKPATLLLGVAVWVSVSVFIIFGMTTALSGDIATISQQQLQALTGPLWLLLAVGPALGGASAETATITRLGAAPVGGKTLFFSSWASAGVDVPYLVAIPVILGSGIAVGGLSGGFIAFGFLIAASAVGQMAAWGWLGFAAGKKHPGRQIGLTASVVVGGLVGLNLIGVDVGWIKNLVLWPGHQLVETASGGALWPFVAITAGCVIPAVSMGGWLVDTARRKETAGQTGGGAPKGWSGDMNLYKTWLSSLTRAVAVQVTVITLAFTPALPAVLGVTESGINALGDVVVISLVAILGVNFWSFAGGGITVLLTSAKTGWQHIGAMAGALGSVLVVGQIAVIAAGTLAGLESSWGVVLGAVVARTFLLCGWALWFSTRKASSADWDSLRVRPSEPGQGLIFALGGATLLGMYALGRDVGGVYGPVAATIAAIVVSFLLLWNASCRLEQNREKLLDVSL